jgi:hypothetical protein
MEYYLVLKLYPRDEREWMGNASRVEVSRGGTWKAESLRSGMMGVLTLSRSIMSRKGLRVWVKGEVTQASLGNSFPLRLLIHVVSSLRASLSSFSSIPHLSNSYPLPPTPVSLLYLIPISSVFLLLTLLFSHPAFTLFISSFCLTLTADRVQGFQKLVSPFYSHSLFSNPNPKFH